MRPLPIIHNIGVGSDPVRKSSPLPLSDNPMTKPTDANEFRVVFLSFTSDNDDFERLAVAAVSTKYQVKGTTSE